MELTDKTCTITFSDNTEKTLVVASDAITYDNEKIKIPDKMEVDLDNIICKIDDISKIAILKAPITYARQDRDYGIELYNLSEDFTY